MKEGMGALGCGKSMQHDSELCVFVCSDLPHTEDTSVRLDIHTHYYDLLFVLMPPSNLRSPWPSQALTDRVVNSINAQ